MLCKYIIFIYLLTLTAIFAQIVDKKRTIVEWCINSGIHLTSILPFHIGTLLINLSLYLNLVWFMLIYHQDYSCDRVLETFVGTSVQAIGTLKKRYYCKETLNPVHTNSANKRFIIARQQYFISSCVILPGLLSLCITVRCLETFLLLLLRILE